MGEAVRCTPVSWVAHAIVQACIDHCNVPLEVWHRPLQHPQHWMRGFLDLVYPDIAHPRSFLRYITDVRPSLRNAPPRSVPSVCTCCYHCVSSTAYWHETRLWSHLPTTMDVLSAPAAFVRGILPHPEWHILHQMMLTVEDLSRCIGAWQHGG